MSTLDLAIDLGSCNMRAGVKKTGITVDEPSVVAINPNNNNILGIGKKVYDMIGRENDLVEVIYPLSNGVINNFKMTNVLAKYLFKTSGKNLIIKPRVITTIPCKITSTEAKSIIETFVNVGAREVLLINSPIASALGAGIDISKPSGNLIVDIGGGTTDVALISLNGIVNSFSGNCAGNTFDETIKKYIKDSYSILIGDQTARTIKETFVNLDLTSKNIKFEVKGHSLISELPEKVVVSSHELTASLKKLAYQIVRYIRYGFENTPPELVGDINQHGIYLTGGGALIKGIDKIIETKIGVDVMIPENPASCCPNGVLKSFDCIGENFYGFFDPYKPLIYSRYQTEF